MKTDLNPKIRMQYKIWMESPEGEGIMGDGKWLILKTIEQTGSLKAATEALGLTYRRTWGDLKKIETQLGISLLDKSRGGAQGGASSLSNAGKQMVAAFDELHENLDGVIKKAFIQFQERLADIEI
ncbi:MAG TPA: LysR family transcriptional regulator [Bacteroidales bacterium]|nr:LysR family transcriptional regulator [Bacteroidales bacterium]